MPNLEPTNPIYKDFRIGDIRHSLADISKAERLLKYKPTHSFLEGIEDTVDWYINKVSS